MPSDIGHRLLEQTPVLTAGRLIPQLDDPQQDGREIPLQVRRRHAAPHQLQAGQGREGLLLAYAQGGGEAGRREAGGEHEVLTEGLGAQGLLHAADVLVGKAGDLLGAGALHHAGENGRVHLACVQMVQLAVAAGAGEEADGIRRQHMLAGQDVPVGPEAGDLLEAGRQGAQPLGGPSHGHIPALPRGIGGVLGLGAHGFYAAAGERLHPGGIPLEEHGVGGQVPAQENVLRIFQEVLQQGVPQAGPGLGVGRAGGRGQDGEEGDGVALGPEVDVQLGRGLVDLLDGQLPRHNALEEHPAGVLLVLLRLPVELDQIAAVGPLALDFLPELREHVQQGFFRDGLQEIPVHADVDCLPGVLEVVVTGDDDDFHLRKLPADQLAEGQTVHEGHPDVGDEHVGLRLADGGRAISPSPASPAKV